MVCLKLIYLTLSIVPGKYNCYIAENCIRGKRNRIKRKYQQVICSQFMGDFNLVTKRVINQIEKLDTTLNSKFLLVTINKIFSVCIPNAISTLLGHQLKSRRWVISGECLVLWGMQGSRQHLSLVQPCLLLPLHCLPISTYLPRQ